MSNKKVAVLDIASDVVTLVVQDGKLADNFNFKASREYDGFYDGEFLDKEGLFKVVASLVSECEKATFSKIQEVMVGVPGEFTAVTCKEITEDFGVRRKITERDEEKLLHKGEPKGASFTTISASAVYFELDDGTAIVTPSGAESQTLRALVSYITCEKSFVSLFDAIAEQLGLRFRYTSSVHAELMCVCPDDLRDSGVILVDVGFSTTSVAYAYGDGILHALSFSLGSAHIATDMMDVLGIPFEHALSILEKINLNVYPRVDDAYSVAQNGVMASYSIKEVNEVAIAKIRDIAENVIKALNLSEYPVGDETMVLLTGAGIAHIPGAREQFSTVLSRVVEILIPEVMQFNKPRYSQLAGLLTVQQRQLKQKKTLDFINIIKDKLFRRK